MVVKRRIRRTRVSCGKGINIPLVPVDMGAMGHRGTEVADESLAAASRLELDDGSVLTESVAICRYFKQILKPRYLGRRTGRAKVRRQRRMELNLLMPVAHAFRHIHRR